MCAIKFGLGIYRKIKMKSIFKTIISVIAFSFLGGCASVSFYANDKNEYAMHKVSDACAVGMPSITLDFLRQEAIKFCASRKERVEELDSKTTVGIPAIRCTDATLKFKCVPWK